MSKISQDKKEWRLRVSKLLGYTSEDTSQAMKVVWGASVISNKDLEDVCVDDAIATISRIERVRCLDAYNKNVRNNPNFKNLFAKEVIGRDVEEKDTCKILSLILDEMVKMNAQMNLLREEMCTFNETFGISGEGAAIDSADKE